ncbi:MAG: hypothetical protein ACLTGI_07520 [Hoylesella buccalis]
MAKPSIACAGDHTVKDVCSILWVCAKRWRFVQQIVWSVTDYFTFSGFNPIEFVVQSL